MPVLESNSGFACGQRRHSFKRNCQVLRPRSSGAATDTCEDFAQMDLNETQPQAPSHAGLQVQPQPALCREALGRGRALPESKENAPVLSVGEKSRIRALDRTPSVLRLRAGMPSQINAPLRAKRYDNTLPRTAHCVWAGHRGLHAAPLPSGIHPIPLRHQHRNVAGDLRLIAENYSTHRHPRRLASIQRHPRFHFLFTRALSSWLDLVEPWFREITDNASAAASYATSVL